MRRIAKFGLTGAVMMPVAFLVFGYAYGLTFRPEDMTIGETFQMINEGTWHISTFSQDILPIWMPIGGIVGVIASLIARKKRVDKAGIA